MDFHMSDLYWLSATTVGNHFKFGFYVFISKSTRSLDCLSPPASTSSEKEGHFVTPVSTYFNIVSGTTGELPSLKVILSSLDTILISKTTKIVTDVDHFKRSSLTFSFIHS
ncbi:hypothetical protein YC2023_120047 [Brassica napus]